MQAAKAMGWLTTAKLIAEATELRKTINAENLYRFQSIYGLCKDHQTSWVQLAIDVSLRDRGEQVWTLLQGWIGSAALHTMGCRLRRERGYMMLGDESFLISRSIVARADGTNAAAFQRVTPDDQCGTDCLVTGDYTLIMLSVSMHCCSRARCSVP
ncbi:unnamed protein product [Symbiodinium sp. KB8]|nr:unnamed protein product [Symbiodinium sp. KB8]